MMVSAYNVEWFRQQTGNSKTILHLVRGVASRLNLIRSIELSIFEGKGLEVALAGRTAVRQACVTVVLGSDVHLCGVADRALVQHGKKTKA